MKLQLIKTDMKTVELNGKEKFVQYFRLNDDIFFDDDDISGELEHEGVEVNFHLYLSDEDAIYDITIDEEFITTYSRDIEGANHWLEHCWRRGIGFEFEVDYTKEIDWEWHPFDFVKDEHIYEYCTPSIECLTLETV